MAQRIWRASEFDGMTPADRAEIFESSIVYKLDEAPAELIERARARLVASMIGEESAGE
jgi:hypothetical protein